MGFPAYVKMKTCFILKCSETITTECFVWWRVTVFDWFRLFHLWIKNRTRVSVKFCFKLRKGATETYNLLKTAFGDKCLSWLNVFIWFSTIQNGLESVDDDPRSGRRPTSINNENIAKIRNFVRSDGRLMTREMAN